MAKENELDSQALEDFRVIAKERKPIQFTATCSSCRFFKDAAIYSQKCYALGVMADSDPCKKFFPHLRDFDSNELLQVFKIVKYLKGLTPKQVQAVLLLTQQPDGDESRKFKTGDEVYAWVSNGQEEYWAPATVLFANRAGIINAITKEKVWITAKASAFSHELPNRSEVDKEDKLVVVDVQAEIAKRACTKPAKKKPVLTKKKKSRSSLRLA